MADYDVFNGDADGICALHMLRLAEPRAAVLVTGVKRDIGLLAQVSAAAGDRVTVLDISLDKNRAALERVLAAGAQVAYFDHHYAGAIPDHPALDCHIDTAATTCTSLIANDFLGGRYAPWAVTAAFGDNLEDSARALGLSIGLDAAALEALQSLGECLNYNGYGESPADLFYPPAELYRRVHGYDDPLDMVRRDEAYARLRDGYREDMARAEAIEPLVVDVAGAVFVLPCEPWSRRVSGVFGNALAKQHPERAHAVLTVKDGGGYLVSVRAPIVRREGADALCRQFETGGGRKAAAGINHLPETELARFLQTFNGAF